MAGAVLISDPQATVSAGTASGASAYLGYVLPLLSGVSLGFIFISSRKSKSASPMLLPTSSMIFRCVTCCTLMCIPAANSGGLQILAASPGCTVLLLLALLVAVLVSYLTCSIGSQLCPAAISATAIPPTNMITGYAADILLFRKVPNMSTIFGAVITLLAMVAAAAKFSASRRADPQLPVSRKRAWSTLSHLSMQSGRTHLARSFGSEQCRHPRLQQRRNSELCRHS